jgi:hypothetical protein
MQNLTTTAAQFERRVKAVLRHCDIEALTVSEKDNIGRFKTALHEAKLDIRDYEYAESRDEQLKWAKIGRHNLAVVNTLMLRLDTVFGAADVAEFGATIDLLQAGLE